MSANPRILAPTATAITEAARVLNEGGLVGMPTETVYGLAANACDGQAVARIFAAKGRPAFNPLIVHLPDLDAVRALAELSPEAENLAATLWPGPITLILPRRKDSPVSDLATAGLDTIAIRIPAHPVAQALLKAAGCPVAAPSANRSGTLSPTTPAHVAESLGEAVTLILAGGACPVGLESTVLDMTATPPVILRPGAVTAEQIAAILGHPVAYDFGTHDRPRSPGQTLRHYSPSIPVRINAVDVEPGEALLAFGPLRFMGIRGGGAAADLPPDSLRNLSETRDLNEAASNLFAMLRALDKPQHSRIAVMPIPDQGLGIAINERLRRAANA